jgi:hypothetical protein
MHTTMLNSFCENLDLNPAVRHTRCGIDYTYQFNMTRFCILDHFFLSGAIFSDALDSISVVHDIDNLSDHDPIELHLSLKTKFLETCDRVYKPRVSWVKATESDVVDYRSTLSARLQNIALPIDTLLCDQLLCGDVSHLRAVNGYAQDLADALVAAANLTIPLSCERQAGRCVPGWSERVQPLRDKSLFWHRIWVDCGRPRSGAVADSMRRTRAAYHYAVRQIKKDEDSVVRERIASALLNDSERNFWAEIKRIRGNRGGTSKVVDGLSDVCSIAQLFTEKYRELYTSVSYNESEMKCIINDLNCSLTGASVIPDCIFNSCEVRSAVSKLKCHKSDGCTSLSSDHFLNAGDDFMTHVALLFTAMLIHGTAPDNFQVSTIVPIPKGHNANASDSSNFRGIALSSIFGKILDNIILERYSSNLMSCDLQFGFKAKCSTNLCTTVLKETMAYYAHGQTPVFCTFLDITKAFDKLHYCKLFKFLIKRRLPAYIIRLLINLYTHNFVRIAWCGVTYEYFLAANGVKQGAVLSPVLFCVYIDDLLSSLAKAGIGCYIGSHFVGAIAYADDIVLTAPTATAMRRLLTICEEYARAYCISFNASKSKCLVIVPSKRRGLHSLLSKCTFCIDNKPIEFVNSFTHLGHIISNDLSDDMDILKRRNDFIGQVNNVLCYFQNLSSVTKYKLFCSYCTSFFGCELWSLSNDLIENFCIAWRKSIRRIWSIPPRTHSSFLPHICNCLPVLDELCRRFVNFVSSCVSHQCSVVRFVSFHGLYYARGFSPLGQNVSFCMRRYCRTLHDLMNLPSRQVILSFLNNSIDTPICNSANFVSELLLLREGTLELSSPPAFSYEELQNIIEYVCTH